jgi:hypothetical protein
MTETEATIETIPHQRLRDAAADALEWLRWMAAGPLIRDFGRRQGLGDDHIAENDALLAQAIEALETALKEEER